MPHYADGTEAKVGDKVTVTGVISSIQTAEDYCNASVALPPMPPYTTPYNVTFNTKQLTKLSDE